MCSREVVCVGERWCMLERGSVCSRELLLVCVRVFGIVTLKHLFKLALVVANFSC